MEQKEGQQKGHDVMTSGCVTFAASCVAVHLVKHTCSTKAPPMRRARTMSYDLCLTATEG